MEQGMTVDQVVQMVSDVHFGTRGVNVMSDDVMFYLLEKAELDRRYERLKKAREEEQREVCWASIVEVMKDNTRKFKQLEMEQLKVGR